MPARALSCRSWAAASLLTALAAGACAIGVAGPAKGQSNDSLLQQWNQQTGAQGTLNKGVDGTQLQWTVNANADLYRNRILSDAPNTYQLTPLRDGSFYRFDLHSDMRWLRADGAATHLQALFQGSDDRAVLSQHVSQLQNFQAGHAGPGYQLLLGDVAASFSPLGSTLGLRGLLGTTTLGKRFGLSAHAGVVSESWEALINRTPRASEFEGAPPPMARTRYLRDVWGTKLEYGFDGGWRAFTSVQGYADRADSLGAAAEFASLRPADGSAVTGGLAYQHDAWEVLAEWAAGSSRELDQPRRSGSGFVVDGSYRLAQGFLRAGYHNVEPTFSSLAQTVQPGIHEGYVGADWAPSPRWTLGIDLRLAEQETAPIVYVPPAADPPLPAFPEIPATRTRSASVNARASLNLHEWLPGASVNLMTMEMRGRDAQDFDTETRHFGAGVQYAQQLYNFGLNYTRGESGSDASVYAASTSDGAQLVFGLNFVALDMNGRVRHAVQVLTTVQSQTQRQPATGDRNESTSYALRVNGEWEGKRRLALLAQQDIIDSPIGRLTSTAWNLEAGWALWTSINAKLYTRAVLRNRGFPALAVDEQVHGVGIEGRF
jgi:hypothetical protein